MRISKPTDKKEGAVTRSGGMRILVIGAAGFVGRHLVRVWREQTPDAEIWSFVRGDEGHDVPLARLVSG